MSGQYHGPPKTKRVGNGKKIIKSREKRKYEIGGYFTATRLSVDNDDEVRVNKECKGNVTKTKAYKFKYVNLLTKEGYKKVKATGVIESAANRNYPKLNIVTKGTVINTELGKAIVISRPGQDGSIVAKLIENQ
ncbi:MAG: 30S ribosomal protein S8e [Candidatus Micrarchaeota archaeon]|nr:MAG: 30S ribosomal protein S8e [Candidatus Micrarchaeota archaeon]